MSFGKVLYNKSIQLFKMQRKWLYHKTTGAFHVAQMVKNLIPVQETWVISGLGRTPREGNSNPLQYSCLENSMSRDAWQAAVHSIGNDWTTNTHTNTWRHETRLSDTQNISDWLEPLAILIKEILAQSHGLWSKFLL